MNPRLRLDYFDGHSARPQSAEIWLSDGHLHLSAGAEAQYPAGEVRWPERQRHGQRQAQLPDGGLLSCADAAAWDAWAQGSGLRDPLAVHWTQSWRRVLLAVMLLLALLFACWRWGAPLAADLIVQALPASAEQQIGSQSLDYLDRHWLQPSTLDADQREQIARRFERLVAASAVDAAALRYQLHFRAGSKLLGPNAFALPGGEIVLTDALVELLHDSPDALQGVLVHELGHVRHRHGLRMAVQSGLVGALAGLVVGDFSALLAGLPALLAQQAYSRDFEREADTQAHQMLRSAGLSPRVMLQFFERIAAIEARQTGVPSLLSSHPATPERIAFFSQ
ncbi:MAG: M48 family metallopeptidase [Burkholderiaceae bacterium]|nr:M48 family metallopeptidase [Burkholderiaceae bacterium]